MALINPLFIRLEFCCEYEDWYIKLLCTINEEEINKKGGQVSVTNHQKTREDLLKEIEKEYTKMINQIKNRSKSQSETVGDRVVHR